MSGNRSSEGGGILSITDSDLSTTKTTIRNSTISGNTATELTGGGVRNDSGLTEIEHSTITGNSAPVGAGGVLITRNSDTLTRVLSAVISANTVSDVDLPFDSASRRIESNGHNLIGTGPATAEFDQSGDQVGVTDPGLEPLADNGGPTQTHALKTDSPAIGNADPDDFPETDQRGVERPQGAAPDVGAFELEQEAQPVPAVGLDPQSVDCESQRAGTTSDPESVTVTNTGDADLSVEDVALSGDDADQFSIESQSCTAASVAPQDDCTVDLTFSPTSTGEKDATLGIASDAPGSPHDVALSGTGVAAPPPPPDDPTDTSLALTSGTDIIVFGQSVRLSGRLVDEDGGSLSGKEVTLERRFATQQRFQRVGTLTTNPNGRFSTRVSPPRNAVFRARFTGDGENSASASATGVRVRSVVGLNLSRSAVPVGQNVVIAGNVRPAKTSFVNLTIRRGGQVVVNRRVDLSNQSRYRFVYQVTARGNHLVQVRYPGDRDNLAGAASQRFQAVAAPRAGSQTSVQGSQTSVQGNQTRIQLHQRNQIQSHQRNQTIRGR